MTSKVFSGPVDYLVFSFDEGADIGPGLQALLARVEEGLTEVLDIEFFRRDAAGRPSKMCFSELLGVTGFDLDLLDGADSGILDAEDRETIVSRFEDGQFALAIVYEDRSLSTAAAAWIQSGGSEVFSGGVAIADLERALEEES